MVRDRAPKTVPDVGDPARLRRFVEVATDAGFFELRGAAGGDPAASSVEAGIVAEQLALGASEVPYLGRTLAADLARRAGVDRSASTSTVGLSPKLDRLGSLGDGCGLAIDAFGAERALVLAHAGSGTSVAEVAIDEVVVRTDLTRPVGVLDVARTSDGTVLGPISDADLERWRAFAHAMLAADLLGTMRAAHDMTLEYARERRQYGRPIGSFQAVQHLLADSHVHCEGARSIVDYALWAADAAPLGEAVEAGLVAKIYVGAASRAVCETAVQVHGGIGNTWECMVHVHLRRALVIGDVLGDDTRLLEELADRKRGAAHGLS